jgi:hypothetical protein
VTHLPLLLQAIELSQGELAAEQSAVQVFMVLQ